MTSGTSREGSEIGGRYKIQRLLGEGGFASVYLAVHKVTGMRLALKVLHPSVSQVEGGRERFIRETQIVSQLQHPNIVRIFDADLIEEDGTAYAAMEYLDGESLGERLERTGPLPATEAAPIIGDVLRALSAAHKREVVHRDIKPENIIVTRDHDGRELAKVLDFGIAHTQREGAPKLTQAGMLVGSPLYMSPEQVTGDPVTSATDLWAAGVVFYQSLTGTVPFNADSIMEIFNKILWSQPSPITVRLPRGLEEVFHRALAKRPLERYASAEEMARAIDLCIAIRRPASIRPSSVSVVPASAYHRETPLGDLPRGRAVSAITFEPGPPVPRTPPPPAMEPPPPARPTVPVGPKTEAQQATTMDAFDLDALVAEVKSEPPPIDDPLDFRSIRPPSTPAAASISGMEWTTAAPDPSPPPPPPPPARDSLQVAPTRVDSGIPAALKVERPESEVHTMMSVDVIDRSTTAVRAKERPRSINPWLALVAILSVTGVMVRLAWPHIAAAIHGDPRQQARDEHPPPDLTDTTEPPPAVVPVNVEPQAPLEVGEQVHQPVPAGLDREDAMRFADHVVALPHSDGAPFHTAGFASCIQQTVYFHPGGASGLLRTGRAPVACERLDLSYTADLDGDRVSDIVGVDRRNNGVFVIGTSRLSAGRKFTVNGAREVFGGITVNDGEPGAVVFTNPDGLHPSITAIGLRRGHEAWRLNDNIHLGEPAEFGLAVGPDVNEDHQPDVIVGETVAGQRCFEVLSGTSGQRLWTAPICLDGILVQSLSLGADVNGDGRADVAVSRQGDTTVRLYSGADGTPIREVHAASTAAQFGWPVLLVPDLARDGFADVVVGNATPGSASVEVYSSNDGHRVGAIALQGTVVPSHLRLQFADGFAYENGRSVMIGSADRGVTAVALVAPNP